MILLVVAVGVGVEDSGGDMESGCHRLGSWASSNLFFGPWALLMRRGGGMAILMAYLLTYYYGHSLSFSSSGEY